MASRGSFQKRQKEAARKEKRQMKLDRRQGRAPAAPTLNGHSGDDQPEEHDSSESENGQDDVIGPAVGPDSEKRISADAE
jgi:hypothetical protein